MGIAAEASQSVALLRQFETLCMNRAEFDVWLRTTDRRPAVMGVLNVTPDSFSDGGRFLDPAAAVEHGRELFAAGADVIDVGGESTRPGSSPVEAEEQIRRVVPVIRSLRAAVPCVISIDTGRAETAAAALDAGADLVNDIYAGREDPNLLPLVAAWRVPVILMHMRGRPAVMQIEPAYSDVMNEVIAFLRERLAAAEAAGVDPALALVDPGIGFGKTVEHNLELLRRLPELRSLGRPVVVGTSRKSPIGAITGEPAESGRPFGTAATVAWSVANGADMVRVHDVASNVAVVRMIRAVQRGRP